MKTDDVAAIEKRVRRTVTGRHSLSSADYIELLALATRAAHEWDLWDAAKLADAGDPEGARRIFRHLGLRS